MFTNGDITVINQHSGQYIATPILGVAIFDSVQTSISEKGLVSADKTEVHIPFDANTNSKCYMDKKEYPLRSTEAAQNCWTLIPQKTYLIKGVVSIDHMTIQEILSRYDVKTVFYASANFYGSKNMHHWQVDCN